MDQLTEQEKNELREMAKRAPLPQPKAVSSSLKDFLLAISQLSQLDHPPKPVRFEGNRWKL
ncbi:MAG: hypothetical protein RL117_1265 [Verrucomicrobiota bacterium]|jgi:hypothetical protein